jgi:hypothetical protein
MTRRDISAAAKNESQRGELIIRRLFVRPRQSGWIKTELWKQLADDDVTVEGMRSKKEELRAPPSAKLVFTEKRDDSFKLGARNRRFSKNVLFCLQPF